MLDGHSTNTSEMQHNGMEGIKKTRNSFFDITQVEFWAGPETENKLKMQCKP